MSQKKSKAFTLFGDLDGMTVEEIRRWLDQFSENDRLDAQVEYVYCIGGYQEREFFIFIGEER
jgi:hypothetical protein